MLVIADTHNSNPMSSHTTWSGSEISDRLVTRVAIRPAYMDAWGLKLLASVLKLYPKQTVLHLGDAANLGCRREYKQFLDAMTIARPGHWYMAPGNHDSLAYGNWAGIGGEVTRYGDWVSDCGNERKSWRNPSFNALETKDLLIGDYVAAQHWDDRLTRDVTTMSDRAAHNRCTEFPIGSNPAGELRVHRCVNQGDEYSTSNPPLYISYLLQQIPINNSDTVVILIDTTEFVEFPRVGHTGGQQGGIRNDQVEALENWLRDISAAGKTAIIAGHFPIEMLDSYSRTSLDRIFETYPVIAYLSAHTHDPTNLRMHGATSEHYRHVGSPRVGFPEINIGSLLDWPMTYSTIGLPTTKDPARLFLGVHDVPVELNCDPKFRHAAEYTSYSMHSSTALTLLDKLRHGANRAYAAQRAQMFVDLNHDLGLMPQRTMESELAEAPTATSDAAVDEYETCQVRWASEQELQTKQPLDYFEDPKVLHEALGPAHPLKDPIAGWYIEFLAPVTKPRASTACPGEDVQGSSGPAKEPRDDAPSTRGSFGAP